MKLTPGELRTLALACGAIIPSVPKDGQDAEFYRRSATDMGVPQALAETIERYLEPGPAARFRRLLRILESRPYGMLLDRRTTPFSSLGEREREKLLQSWRDSRISAKRAGFQALKRLTCFLYYSLEPEGRPNPNWSAIGYPGPSSDTRIPSPEETRLTSIVPTGDLDLSCDVCVVGAGAGGSAIAKEVSEAGYKVVILEAGGYETSETYKQSELQMTRKLFQQGGTASTTDLSITLLGGRGVGGGTAVNWNTCLRPPIEVLQEWEGFGIDGVAGPSFAAHLDEVWRTLRVGPQESQRNWNNEALWQGCKALGYAEGTDFEVINRNAVGCNERCGFCTFGCVYSCKQSTSMNYLPAASRLGARFLFNTKVEAVTIENGKASGVVADYGDGTHRVRVKAKIVVVACGGLETPALLLRSGVRHRKLGKHLTLDPTVPMGGIFGRAVNAWEGPPQTVAVRKFWNIDGTRHGFWVEAAPAHPGLFGYTVPWTDGESHKRFVRENFARTTATIILLREWGDGTVKVDSHGSPVVTYALDKRDRQNLIEGMMTTARILAAAGAMEIWSTHNSPIRVGSEGVSESDLDRFASQVKKEGVEYNRINLFSAHLMGSCRMSSDTKLGPTKPTGELHEVENVFIGDATVFPTTPAVNPMISTIAMARRTSDFIKSKLSGRST
ncbi:MAG TPA: GMC family oxidoreductase N-terminal domain-containing protein [Nitrososphaerales archaeon]|nr:GMC family oxidoreductase N-terminal domain-containing protein [Nitrososphaerales archaeon]